MPSPNAGRLTSRSFVQIAASCLAVMFTSTCLAQVQIPEQILKDEKITVVELSAQQALFELQKDYEELAGTKGANHPETREKLGQLTEVKRRLAALGMNGTTPPASVPARQSPPLPGPSGNVNPEDLLAEQDPWQILLGLVQRVAKLEAQVAELKAEVRQLRSTQPNAGNRFVPGQLPDLPAATKRETSPAVPIPR